MCDGARGSRSDADSLGACSLPASDSGAFCTSPVVHPELADPTQPGEVVVSYGVSTTTADAGSLPGASPKDDWTRLAWVPAP